MNLLPELPKTRIPLFWPKKEQKNGAIHKSSYQNKNFEIKTLKKCRFQCQKHHQFWTFEKSSKVSASNLLFLFWILNLMGQSVSMVSIFCDTIKNVKVMVFWRCHRFSTNILSHNYRLKMNLQSELDTKSPTEFSAYQFSVQVISLHLFYPFEN